MPDLSQPAFKAAIDKLRADYEAAVASGSLDALLPLCRVQRRRARTQNDSSVTPICSCFETQAAGGKCSGKSQVRARRRAAGQPPNNL